MAKLDLRELVSPYGLDKNLYTPDLTAGQIMDVVSGKNIVDCPDRFPFAPRVMVQNNLIPGHWLSFIHDKEAKDFFFEEDLETFLAVRKRGYDIDRSSKQLMNVLKYDMEYITLIAILGLVAKPWHLHTFHILEENAHLDQDGNSFYIAANEGYTNFDSQVIKKQRKKEEWVMSDGYSETGFGEGIIIEPTLEAKSIGDIEEDTYVKIGKRIYDFSVGYSQSNTILSMSLITKLVDGKVLFIVVPVTHKQQIMTGNKPPALSTQDTKKLLGSYHSTGYAVSAP